MFSPLLFRVGRGGGGKFHSNCTAQILCCFGAGGLRALLLLFFYTYKICKDYLATCACGVEASIASGREQSLQTNVADKSAVNLISAKKTVKRAHGLSPKRLL